MQEDMESLINRGESELLEFKTSFGREAMETLCALANTRGSTVLIGVTDRGEVNGVQASQETTQQWINQIKSSTSPSIIPDAGVLDYRGKTVVALSVISYPIKPISFKGKYYKRLHNSNHFMGLTEIANEHLNNEYN